MTIGDPKNASHRVSLKLLCITQNKLLIIRKKNQEHFNLVGGGVDKKENIAEALQRELSEETGKLLGTIVPELIHTEIQQFPDGGDFDAVVNIFYILNFPEIFEPLLEKNIYEEYQRVNKEELETIPMSEHSNKEFLLTTI